ncbi:myrosinase 1-like isoform X3 [Aphis gossypii]|uniref:myrosinase 1-like isoform X3 n=1 Tax=Aphis gossypii TaxID=80765 RepID=UPI002158A970|nr:myrosinase 1-like isoform X3 [Aphis gossypii]
MANEKAKRESFVSTKQFPDNFLLGTSTGAYQVEGAWNEDKAESIWDHYFHSNEANRSFRYFLDLPESVIEKHIQKGVKPRLADLYKGMGVYEFPSSAIEDGTHFNFNGDIAADSYHKTDIDVKLLKELGVQVYRFSIAPTRIIPRVHDNTPGKEGIAYYNNLIDKLIENGITPMACLYHFDVGECFNKIGGLSNPVSYKFYPNFSRICFENFGDRVKHWSTAADIHLATEGYSSEHFAPGYQESIFSGFLEYEAIHNSMITQSLMWKVYNDEFKEKQKGEVSLTIDGVWYYPKDPNNPEHQKCAESARMSTFGLIAHILFTGQYPDEFLEAIDRTNKREKIRVDRARQFTKKEQELIKGAYDFIVLNYYNSVKVRPMTDEEYEAEPNLKKRDRGFIMDLHSTTETEVYEGFLNILRWFKEKMDNPKIFIGENGFPEEEGIDDSEKKIAYHTGILNKLLEALDENINVFGYCIWSFIDTLEFTFGYWKRFGIYAVDFNDESRPRSKKNSFSFFQQLFQTKKLQIKN